MSQAGAPQATTRVIAMNLSSLPEEVKVLRRNIISQLGEHTSVVPEQVAAHNRAWGSCVPGTLVMVGIAWLEAKTEEERRLYPVVTIDPNAKGLLKEHMAIIDRGTNTLLDLTPAAARAGKLTYDARKQQELWSDLLLSPTLEARTQVLLDLYNKEHGTNYTYRQVLDAAHQAFEQCVKLNLASHLPHIAPRADGHTLN